MGYWLVAYGVYGVSKMITPVAGRCARNWQDVAGSCRWVELMGRKSWTTSICSWGCPKIIRMVRKKEVKPPCQVWLMYWLASFKPLQPTS